MPPAALPLFADRLHQARSARVLWVLIMLVDGVLALRAALVGNPTVLVSTSGVALVGLVSVLLLLRSHHQLASHLLLLATGLATVVVSLTGHGFYGGASFFLVLMPLLGGLFVGRSGASLWALLVPVAMVGIAAAHHQGLVPVPAGALPVSTRLGTMLVQTAMVVGCSFAFLRLQRETLARLGARIAAVHRESQDHLRAEQEAQVAAETQGRFLATMGHELRTPLSGVISAARLIGETEDPRLRAELVGLLQGSAEGLLGLVDDILDHVRLGDGAIALRPTALRPREAMDQWIGSLQVVAQERGLGLSVFVEDSVPDVVLMDSIRMGQVVLSLVDNALKFTPAGEVVVRLAAEDGRLCLSVRDTGIGLDAEAADALFAAFTQAESSCGRRFGGLGLGLALVQRIVELMDGEVGVRSAAGAGATFTVRVPLRCPAQEPAAAEAPPPTGPLRVLVVDDNPVNRRVQTLLLASWGHEAVAVASGTAALGALAAPGGAPGWDLVLMDCQMPELDGYATPRHIRALAGPAADLPVVGLTADDRPEARAQAQAAGMDGFLVKPLRAEALARALQRLGPVAADRPAGGRSTAPAGPPPCAAGANG